MKLKKIELFGFKSFADKTELCFESGVTAIVGPNGVGKSNIAEAIKWVLGEQNARELRGLKMEDVIFNGTETRSPLNFSEVSLAFQNKDKILPIDYDEVVIARRIFRTGESQYLLNKTPVRLKDINDLLIGTGVGLDSYSIIGQGKIDLILSSKPEDRRYIFEEAAGITKYKSKKQEALRKLQHTENNLLRVNDIIQEVSRQISSIQRLVRKAKKYKEKFEQLKEKQIKVSSYDLKKLKNILNSHLGESQEFKKKEKLFLEEIKKSDLLLLESKQKLSEIDENLNSLYSKKVNINAQIENARQQVNLNTERITELQRRKENSERQIQSTQIKLQELREQITKSREELAALKEDRLNKAEEKSQKEQQLKEIACEIENAEKNIKDCKGNIFEVSSLESRTKNELARISADEVNVKARLKRIKIEKEEVREELEKTREKLSHFDAKKEETSKEIYSLKKQEEQVFGNANSRKQALLEIKNQLEELNQKSIASQSKLEYLNDLKRKFEGYQNGVKAILMAKEQAKLPQDNIFGPIANLIEVERGYDLAIEVALGNMAQILIVHDESMLKECIDYLKTEAKGGATFICLDTVPDIKNSSDFNLKPLLNVVSYSSEFEKVIRFLFADIYLVENLETALKIRREARSKNFKLVTRNGDVVENNLVTCGIRQLQESSLIGRGVRIKILEEDINKYNYEKKNLGAAKQKEEEELENFEITSQELNSTIQQKEIGLANLSSGLKSIEEEKKRIDDEVSLLNLEITETEEEEIKLTTSRQRLRQEIEESGKSFFELKSTMTSKENLIKVKKEEREQLLIDTTQLKTELTSLTDLEINQNQTVKMLEDGSSEALALFNTQKQEIEDGVVRLKNLELDISKIKQNIERLEEDCQLASGEFKNVSALKENQLKNTSEIEALNASRQEEFEKIKNSMHNSQVKSTELNYQIQNLKERIFENYKVNLEEIKKEIEDGFDCERAKEEISQAKEKLDSMGTVNLVAIEEHRELQERFDFLNKQKEDLQEAKESLHKVIIKINKTTKKLFIETFAKIQVGFMEFFRLLFGGGKAELILSDESDVLESGIEINARPPGKKLQNISLLSGGEKALTAVALLFAVFKVKPSPFCILDEMDAPLDESNIDRFTKVLQDFLKTSQFIVITHNKKTIGMADVMYGVTMAEAGISKIVSVKFKDSDEDSDKVVEEAVV